MRVTPISKTPTSLRLVFFTLFAFFAFRATSQMISDTDTLLGNEWIVPGQSYFSFDIARDGVYRISYDALQNAGIPTSSISEDAYQLIHNGKEIPLRATGEFLEFVGQKNRGEIDAYLYQGGDQDQLNPYYSLYTDTAVYYLTWGPGEHRRYADVQAGASEPATWFWQDVLLSFNTTYYKPYELNNTSVKFAHYVPGEGYGTSLRVTSNYTIEAPELYAGGPNSVLDAGFVTRDDEHRILVRWNGMPLDTLLFTGLEARRIHFTLSSLNASNNIRIQGLAGGLDRHYLGYINVRYPRTFSRLPEGWIQLDSFAFAQSIVVDSVQSNWAAWNPELDQYLQVTDTVMIFPAEDTSSWFLTSKDSIQGITSLTPVQFADVSQPGQILFITNPAFLPEAEQYASYRASSEGGSWTTTILSSEALTNTFAYGIDRHPLAIKNAIQAVARNSTEEHYIFLIGKSLEYPTKRNDPSIPVWLPSYGDPAGDNLLVSRGFDDVPTYPVGRLAVNNGEQILEYLQKVKTYEENQRTLPSTYEDRIWTKRILHLSAGTDPAEQTIIHNGLDAMAQEAETNLLGAEVHTVAKENTEVLAISQTDEILDALNEGVLLKTYFGHGSVVTTQFVIDQATQLNNPGKNPMMYSLGCYTGNIHTPILSASENMVLHPALGAIGYVATSGTGYISALSIFAQEHYRLLGNEWYGAPFGKVMQKSVAAFANQQNIPTKLIREEITYQGDPVIRLNVAQGPDYTFKPQSASITPQLLTTTTDSFTVVVTVANLGSTQPDSIGLLIERQTPDGQVSSVFSRRIKAPSAEEPVSVNLPVGDAPAGENQLYFTLDPDNVVAEWPDPVAENNNYYGVGLSFQVVSEAIAPTYPANYAIVSGQGLTLYASVSNGAATGNTYRIELDTLPDFTSPARVSQAIAIDGALLAWTPGVSWIQDQVYYWRVSLDSTENTKPYSWQSASFLISDTLEEGWNQSHWGQWDDDTLVTLEVDRDSLRYRIRKNNLLIRSSIADPPTTAWWINSQRYDRHWPINGRVWSGIHICVLEPDGLLPWYNPPGGILGSINQLNEDRPSFPFELQDTSILDSIFYLLDSIPDGYFVLFQTVQYGDTSYFPQHWAIPNAYDQQTLFGFLEAQGAEDLATIKAGYSVPYFFLFRKNHGKIAERIATDVHEWIDTSLTIYTTLSQGVLASPLIGPVNTWNQLNWKASPESEDTMSLEIIPVAADGTEQPALHIDKMDAAGVFSLDSINTPYLRFRWTSRDEIKRTPPPLDHFQVIFQGLPDVTWEKVELNSGSVKAGESIKLRGTYRNVSRHSIGSFRIATALDKAGNTVVTDTTMQEGLASFEPADFSIDLPAPLYGGDHVWKVELNPPGMLRQAENNVTNNSALGTLAVEGDNIAPLLDVTFDGKHLPDLGIVSPEPAIGIFLYEEQQSLLLDDTALFTITLIDPAGVEIPVYFSRPDLTFYPALPGQSQNEARILWQPTFWADGIYILKIEAKDKSGNLAGGETFVQRFKIEALTDLMQVAPYPNPFTSEIRWIFTADQSGYLPQIQMSLYQANGQLIRVWENEALQAKAPGKRVWEFSWDGRSAGGDLLPGGVYYYNIAIEYQNGDIQRNQNKILFLPSN